MDKYKQAYKINTTYTAEEIKELREIITAIEEASCHCDWRDGCVCGIHSLGNKARKILNK